MDWFWNIRERRYRCDGSGVNAIGLMPLFQNHYIDGNVFLFNGNVNDTINGSLHAININVQSQMNGNLFGYNFFSNSTLSGTNNIYMLNGSNQGPAHSIAAANHLTMRT